MRKLGIVVAAAILTFIGLGEFAGSTSLGGLEPSTVARIDPFRMMVEARGLPTQRLTDFSLVFVAQLPPATR